MNSSGRPRVPALDIAFVTYSSGWGGAEIHTLQLATMLAERGHTVTLVERKQSRYSAHADLGAREIRRATKLGRSDVTVLVKAGFGHGSLLFDLTARLRSRVYLTIEHTLPPSPRPLPQPRQPGDPRRYPLTRQRWRLLRLVETKLPRVRAWVGSMTICVSDAIRINLETVYGFPIRKLRVVRNGVDAARFIPSTQRRDAARSAWRVAESSTVIGTLGRLDRAKGVSDVLDSAARIISDQPERDVRVVIVGEGEERAALADQAARLGIASRVVFAGPTDHPENAYPGFDVFALASHGEGLPLALLEAMSTGLVPVCTAVGGIPEVITSPELGWIVELGNAAAFTAALVAAAGMDPLARASMGGRCRERIINSFDANRAMQTLAEMIEVSGS